AVAQERHYNIYNLSADHGLPSNDVTHVFQDSYGYLWIGSYEGIFRWDGYAFKRYRHNEKDSASLSHNIVYSIFEDSQQRLWVGTIEGLDLYDRHTDTFIKCTISETTRRIPVNAITEDSQHRLWLGTSHGLCLYDHKTGQAQWFQDESFDTIFCLTIDQDDNVWTGTFNGGVKKFSPETKSFRHFTQHSGTNALTSNNIRSIMCDERNRIWVGTMDRGIAVLDADGNVINRYRRLSGHAADAENTINCIYQDRNKRIWIGVGRESLYYIDEETGKPVALDETALNSPHNAFASVTTIGEDNFGNTWF